MKIQPHLTVADSQLSGGKEPSDSMKSGLDLPMASTSIESTCATRTDNALAIKRF